MCINRTIFGIIIISKAISLLDHFILFDPKTSDYASKIIRNRDFSLIDKFYSIFKI